VIRPLWLIAVAVLVSACGTPPEALPTAPPTVGGGVSAAPSTSGLPVPSFASPSLPPVGQPTYPGVQPTYPTYPGTRPTYPPAPRITTPRPSPTPTPAARCRSGPSEKQVLDVLKTQPGMPTAPGTEFAVSEGPYCSGSWQISTIVIKGANQDPLLLVTTGRPGALKVVAAGGDVCTGKVEDDAPTGIRVRACGS
jgi:hypothetical protein